MENYIKFLVVASDDRVFGVGRTVADAISDAAEKLNGDYTAADVAAEVADGEMWIVPDTDDDFMSFAASAGGLEHDGAGWIDERWAR